MSLSKFPAFNHNKFLLNSANYFSYIEKEYTRTKENAQIIYSIIMDIFVIKPSIFSLTWKISYIHDIVWGLASVMNDKTTLTCEKRK